MNNQDIVNSQKLYALYQLHWMMTHGESLSSLINNVHDYINQGDSGVDKEDFNFNYCSSARDNAFIDVSKMFYNWEDESGFKGSCYVCYDEFMDEEFNDKSYMKELCKISGDKKLLEWYNSFMKSR